MPKGDTYSQKRSFDRTPEPAGRVEGNVDPGFAPPGASFVVQKHWARRLHFDLRLEMMNGDVPVLVSWAVPKGLPRKKAQPHLAVHVEDHPMEYASFSGSIPAGEYGAGEVRVFDAGTYEVLEQGAGKLTFRLQGDRLRGVYHLNQTRDGKDWLVILSHSERDEPHPLPDLTPMAATLVADPFDHDDFIFEIKWDGVRAIAVCTDETLLLSRSRRDITSTYPELAELHDRMVALEAVVDGEIVAMSGGRPSFERLQSRINLQNAHDIKRAMGSIPVSYVAFDLLYLDGQSLIDRPLEERKALLKEVVVGNSSIEVSQWVPRDGAALFEAARAQGLEGVVGKRVGCPYRPGKRTRDWLKVKTLHDADVVVGGWTKGEGSRSSTFGSLLVGAHTPEGLEFLGSVGTGFTEKALADLLPTLREIESPDCPFTIDPRKAPGRSAFGKPIRDPRWVTPELVARVEFRELTSAHRLRAPSFKGLRADKDPEECTLDEVAAS